MRAQCEMGGVRSKLGMSEGKGVRRQKGDRASEDPRTGLRPSN